MGAKAPRGVFKTPAKAHCCCFILPCSERGPYRRAFDHQAEMTARIPVVTIHSGNRQDSRLSLIGRGAPPAAAPAFSVSHRRTCPGAPLGPKRRWPASLTSRQSALAVREERREPQPASWPRAAAGRKPPRGFWPPKAPRTNERPWQERRRPRGSCQPLPTRTIHDAVTYYAHTFGRPHI
jgi:hypothetical protein